MSDREKSDQQSSESPKHWFSAKAYGWGWGLPTCREGWLVIGGVTLGAPVLILAIVLLGAPPIVAILIGTIAPCAVLCVACYLKGPPPRWRWGDGDTDK